MGEKNVFSRVIQHYNSLTRSEIKVADYVLKHKLDIHYATISELSGACGVSEATVTRFCRTLGYRSFSNFKLEIAQTLPSEGDESSVDADLYEEVRAEDSIEQKCQKLCHIGSEALRQTLVSLDFDRVRTAVDLLCGARTVYCFGQGNSSTVAMDAWGRFSSVTAKFHWIGDAHMQADTAALLTEEDVVLYFSFSGSTRALSETGRLIQGTNAKLILVSRFPNSPGAKLADLLLVCGANESPRQQGSIAATIGQLFIIDVLFHEFCARDGAATMEGREKTLRATSTMML